MSKYPQVNAYVQGFGYAIECICEVLYVVCTKVEINEYDGLNIVFRNKRYPDAWSWSITFSEWRDMKAVEMGIQLTMMIVQGQHDPLYEDAIADAQVKEHDAWLAEQASVSD
jgi:hypothetical protein